MVVLEAWGSLFAYKYNVTLPGERLVQAFSRKCQMKPPSQPSELAHFSRDKKT